MLFVILRNALPPAVSAPARTLTPSKLASAASSAPHQVMPSNQKVKPSLAVRTLLSTSIRTKVSWLFSFQHGVRKCWCPISHFRLSKRNRHWFKRQQHLRSCRRESRRCRPCLISLYGRHRWSWYFGRCCCYALIDSRKSVDSTNIYACCFSFEGIPSLLEFICYFVVYLWC